MHKEKFKESWMKLKNLNGFTIPTQVHVITDHLPFYLQKFSKTLTTTSDQTVESVHQDFNSRMTTSKYVVKNFRSRIHGLKLHKGAINYDSYNFGYDI